MPEQHMIIKNKGRSQRSFRLRLPIGKKKQNVKDGLLVVVPGCNPDNGQPGISDPIPKAYLEAEAKNPFLVELFEEGIFTVETIA